MEELGEYYHSKRCDELRDRQSESMLWDRMDQMQEKIDEIVEWINERWKGGDPAPK